MRIALLLLMLTALGAGQTTKPAADPRQVGPQVGQTVPDFELADQNTRPTSLAAVRGRRGAMIVFYRSASW